MLDFPPDVLLAGEAAAGGAYWGGAYCCDGALLDSGD